MSAPIERIRRGLAKQQRATADQARALYLSPGWHLFTPAEQDLLLDLLTKLNVPASRAHRAALTEQYLREYDHPK